MGISQVAEDKPTSNFVKASREIGRKLRECGIMLKEDNILRRKGQLILQDDCQYAEGT